MGYIKKLKNNELVGGTDKHTIYPVTSTKAVFEEVTEGDKSSFKSQETINGEHDDRIKGLENEMPDTIKSITINGGSKTYLPEDGNVELTIYSEGGEDYPGISELVQENAANIENIQNEIGTDTTEDTLSGRIKSLETTVGTGGTVDSRIATTKAELEEQIAGKQKTLSVGAGITLTSEGVISATADPSIGKVVETRPTTDIIEGMIYLVPTTTAGTYYQYVCHDGQWNDGTPTVSLGITTDDTLDSTSSNPIQNAAIAAQIGYFVCGNGYASSETKDVDALGFNLPDVGGDFKIKMNEANTHAGPVYLRFNSNSNTKAELKYNRESVSPTNTWEDGEVISVYYDGTYYQATNAQGGGGKAEKIKYDNSQSGLASNNVQGALDEVADNLICIEELVDIANIFPYSGKNISSVNNKWQSFANYKYLIIPIEYFKNANILDIVGGTGTFIAFLEGNDETVDNTPQYCDGCTLEDLSGKTKKLMIPSDCNFIYISHSYNNASRLPLSVTGITTVSVETRWLSNVKRLKLKGFKGLVFLNGSTMASPTVSGSYYSNYSYIIHPVNQGDVVEIKGKGNGNAYTWGLIDSADNNRIVQSSNINATTNSTIIVIPAGVDNIVINNYDSEYSDYEWYYYVKESINAEVIKQKFAKYISYDNSNSGLGAANVNDAIDLLAQKGDDVKLAIDSYIVPNKYINSQGDAVSISSSSTYKYDSVVKLPINRLREFVVSGSSGSSYIVLFGKDNNVLLSLQGTNVHINNTDGQYYYISFGANVFNYPLYIRGKINTLQQRNIAILGDSIMMLLSQGGITGGTTTYVGIQDGITYDFSQLTNIGGLLYVTSTLVNGEVTSNTIQAEVHNSNQGNLDIETWPALKNVLNANYIINTGRGGARIHGNEITTPYPAYAEVKFNTMPNHCLELKRRVDAGEPSPDVILIWAGTNDFRLFIENGQWIEPTNFDEIMSLDYNSQLLANTNEAMAYKRTFYGAMRFIIEYLYRNFPNATVVFFSPIPSSVDGRSYERTRKIGSYIKNMCERYAVLYVDACVEMGITDIFDTPTKHKWLTDGLHPNDEGKVLYTNYTAKKLEEIFFDKIYG